MEGIEKDRVDKTSNGRNCNGVLPMHTQAHKHTSALTRWHGSGRLSGLAELDDERSAIRGLNVLPGWFGVVRVRRLLQP